MKKLSLSDVTPAPKPEQQQPIPAALLPEAITQATGPPIGLDGIPYHVESIVGRTGPPLRDLWYVNMLWVGYDAPSSVQAFEIVNHLLPYMRHYHLMQKHTA